LKSIYQSEQNKYRNKTRLGCIKTTKLKKKNQIG